MVPAPLLYLFRNQGIGSVALKVNASALRLFVLQASIDKLMPFVGMAKSLGLRPSGSPFCPLTQDELKRPPGSCNVRNFCDWLTDYSDVDESLAFAAMATLGERFPDLFSAATDGGSSPEPVPAPLRISQPVPARPPNAAGWKIDRRPDSAVASAETSQASQVSQTPSESRFSLSRKPVVSSFDQDQQGEVQNV